MMILNWIWLCSKACFLSMYFLTSVMIITVIFYNHIVRLKQGSTRTMTVEWYKEVHIELLVFC